MFIVDGEDDPPIPDAQAQDFVSFQCAHIVRKRIRILRKLIDVRHHAADDARAAGVQAIRSESVRDPQSRANVAILTCLAFAATEPSVRQTWRLRFSATGVQALCDFPEMRLEFRPDTFAADPRIQAMPWQR